MAKEPHWKCGKAKAPRVRVPCPLPVRKRAYALACALFRLYVSEQKWIGMTVFPTEQAEDAFSRRKIAAVSY